MPYDATIAGLTLAGSALSSLATFCVLVCFVVFNKNQRSLRHALVFNLALSDFINATLNTVSGSIYMRDHKLSPSRACTFAGWVEQLSVQATDFSILGISLATLLVIRTRVRLMEVSTTRTILICAGLWVVPLITACTATGLGAMKPVSGNWCWISQKRTDLRYALTHGWRMAIILITVGIYSYVWWYVSRHFKSMGSTWKYGTGKSNHSLGGMIREKRASKHIQLHDPEGEELQMEPVKFKIEVDRQFKVKESDVESQASNKALVIEDYEQDMLSPKKPMRTSTVHIHSTAPSLSPSRSDTSHSPDLHPSIGYHASIRATPSNPSPSHPSPNPNPNSPNPALSPGPAAEYLRNKSRQTERNVKRMLLMNGYPIMYVILWIPGLANRIMEASGKTSNSRVLAVLQYSTQYIGFANSVTYGLSGIWRKGK